MAKRRKKREGGQRKRPNSASLAQALVEPIDRNGPQVRDRDLLPVPPGLPPVGVPGEVPPPPPSGGRPTRPPVPPDVTVPDLEPPFTDFPFPGIPGQGDPDPAPGQDQPNSASNRRRGGTFVFDSGPFTDFI